MPAHVFYTFAILERLATERFQADLGMNERLCFRLLEDKSERFTTVLIAKELVIFYMCSIIKSDLCELLVP